MKKKPAKPISRAAARQVIAANLRRLFERRETNAFELARRHGLCYRTVRRAATGEADPSGSLLMGIADALKVDPGELLRRRRVPKSA